MTRLAYPPPAEYQEFEQFCLELLRAVWERPGLELFAARGEGQAGIDILDFTGRPPFRAAQCKLHGPGKRLTPKEIQDETGKAAKSGFTLGEYYILTTAGRSASAQRAVKKFNDQPTDQRPFQLFVYFWEDLVELLGRHLQVRDRFYGTVPGDRAAILDEKLTAVLAKVDVVATDAVDAELDEVRREVDGGSTRLALRLLDRLEARRGGDLTGWQMWRVTALRGNAHLNLGDYEQAGRLLADARRHSPAHLKARINEAVGYELLGERERAFGLAQELRAEFPDSPEVAAVWVRTAPPVTPSADIDATVSRFVESDLGVALAVSMAALARDDLARARAAAETATRLGRDAPQAWMVLAQVCHQTGFEEPRRDERLRFLGEADGHYGRVVELARPREQRFLEVVGHLGRATVRSLTGDPTADDEFRTGLLIDPTHPDLLRRYAVYLEDVGRAELAIEYARRAVAAHRENHSRGLLAALLFNRGRDADREEALNLWLESAQAGGDRAADAAECAVVTLCRLNRAAEARDELAGPAATALTEADRHGLLGLVADQMGDQATVTIHVDAALAAAGGLDDAATRRLAMLLMRVGRDAAAVPLLQRVVVPGLFDHESRMLFACAARAGRDDMVMQFGRRLREAGHWTPDLVERELDVLRRYDRPAAVELGRQAIARFPDNSQLHLWTAYLAYQDGRPELAVPHLDHLPSAAEADPRSNGRAALGVLQRLGTPEQALAYAYALLRANPDDADAVLLYLMLFLTPGRPPTGLAAPTIVGSGTSVRYRDLATGTEAWVVVEPDNPDPRLDEYPLDHPRVRPLMGLGVGAQATLGSGVQENRVEIVEVVDRYFFRFVRCRDEFRTRFPDRTDFQLVDLARPGAGVDDDLDLTPIFESLDERRRFIERLEQVFASHPVPVARMAEAVGRNSFEVLDALTTRPGLRVWCCTGNAADREAGYEALKSATTIVLDASALYTLHRLGAFDRLRGRRQARWVVSQWTYDRIRDVADDHADSRARFGLSAESPGQYVRTEVTEADFTARQAQMERVIAFIHDCCTVEPCLELAAFDPSCRREQDEWVSRDGLESVCLAARPGYLLWTDELAVAAVGGTHFLGFKRVWTQLVFEAWRAHGVVAAEVYEVASTHLLGWGYSFTCVDIGILLRAANAADWRPTQTPLVRALEQFGHPGVDPTLKVGFAARLTAEAFRRFPATFVRQEFVYAVLGAFRSIALVRDFAQVFLMASVWGLIPAERRLVVSFVKEWLANPTNLLCLTNADQLITSAPLPTS